MPHMVIFYASKVAEETNIQDLVQNVWNASEATGLFDPKAIKVRAVPVEHFLTANTDQPFVHVDAKLFIGRTFEQKQDMIKKVFDSVDALVAPEVSISVEAIDMDKPNYIKR